MRSSPKLKKRESEAGSDSFKSMPALAVHHGIDAVGMFGQVTGAYEHLGDGRVVN